MEKSQEACVPSADHTAPEQPPQDSMWFYRHRARKYGPISTSELKAAAHLGFLHPMDAVLCKGQTAWFMARSLPWLFPDQPSARRL